jgi:hypothetical protein
MSAINFELTLHNSDEYMFHCRYVAVFVATRIDRATRAETKWRERREKMSLKSLITSETLGGE